MSSSSLCSKVHICPCPGIGRKATFLIVRVGRARTSLEISFCKSSALLFYQGQGGSIISPLRGQRNRESSTEDSHWKEERRRVDSEH